MKHDIHSYISRLASPLLRGRETGVMAILVLSLCLFATLTASAQEPVTVTVNPIQRQLPPQLGLYLDNPGKYFTIMLRNNTNETQPLFMGMQLDEILPVQDLSVITPPARLPKQPIILSPNETKVLNLVETKTLFNHLLMSEVSTRGNVDNGLLPEGTYEVHLTAYRWDPSLINPYPLSLPTGGYCTFEICYRASAPKIISPSSFAQAGIQNKGNSSRSIDSQAEIWNSFDFGLRDLSADFISTLPIENPIIVWSPPTTNCGFGRSGITYTLRIVELMPGQSATRAMSENASVYINENLIVPQCVIPANYVRRMNQNSIYIMQVQAKLGAASRISSLRQLNMNYLLLENEGKSEIRPFRLVSNTDIFDNGVEPNKDNGEEEPDEDIVFEDLGALYQFRNPKITLPDFSNSVIRQLYLDEDINLEWKKAWYTGGSGKRQNTIKFEYVEELFQGSVGDNPDQMVQGKPVYTTTTTELRDTIAWKTLIDNHVDIKKGDYIVLRITPRVLNKDLGPDDVKFSDNSVNRIDFIMAERVSTRKMSGQCGEAQLPTDTNLTTQTAEELRGKTIHIGEYELNLGYDLKKDAEKKAFSGTGHVVWRPQGIDTEIAVKFDSLCINRAGYVYAGAAKTFAEGSDNGAASMEKLFSDWGVDNLIGDMSMPYSSRLQGVASRKLSNTAKEIDVTKYFDYFKYGQGVRNTLKTGNVKDVHLPVSLDDIYGGTPAQLQIASMKFTATYAVMDVVAESSLPSSDKQREETLIFGAPRLCMSPDRILPETGALSLLSDVTCIEPETQLLLTFKAPANVGNPTDGCYIPWNADNLQGLQLQMEIRKPEQPDEEKPVLAVQKTIKGKDWDLKELTSIEPEKKEDAVITVSDCSETPLFRLDKVDVGEATVRLRWVATGNENVKAYRVMRRLENESNWTILAEIEAGDMSSNKTIILEDKPVYKQKLRYYYASETIDQSDESMGICTQKSVLFSGPLLMSIPMKLWGVYDKEQGGVRLSWESGKIPVDEPYYYVIYRKMGDDNSKEPFRYLTSMNSEEKSLVDYILQPGQKAQYCVKIMFEGGRQSEPSNTLTIEAE